jgi:hypothetical protein
MRKDYGKIITITDSQLSKADKKTAESIGLLQDMACLNIMMGNPPWEGVPSLVLEDTVKHISDMINGTF